MPLEIKVPTVGESITEVLIGQWLKPEGAAVAMDESVVSLETDKVNVDVPAPAAGILTRILKPRGEMAKIGEVIAYIDDAAQATAAPAATAPTQQLPSAQRIMPAAQRLMDAHKLDAAQVTGTGPGGRVLKEDVQAAVNRLSDGMKIPLVFADPPAERAASPDPAAVPDRAPVPDLAPVPDRAAVPDRAPAPLPAPPSRRRTERVAMTPLRRKVAERLVQAQANAAILTTFNEVDMSAVMELRKTYQDEFVQRHGVKLGFMSFFVRACVDALQQFPLANAQIQGDDILMQHFWDIGVAVGGGKGLVVPVLRDADQLTLAEIEKKLADFGARAKAGTLKLDELTGGTFSISNGGVYGSMMSTPILNPPQSAILGMHNIIERPVGVGGQVVLRPMMYLALSYDHRLIDGREAVQFLVHVKRIIEAPARLLLAL